MTTTLHLRSQFLWRSISALMAAMSVHGQGAGTGSPAEKLLNAGRPLVIGHRGYSQMAPENTLPSFKLAKNAGADMVELDYYHTKDGELIVFHDGDLDRTTDAVAKWGVKKTRIGTKTLAELKTLDAGKWFDVQFTGTRLSTLGEALDFIQDGGVTLIERKAGDAATLVKLLRDRKLVNQLVVQSFEWDFLADFHKQEAAQILGALGPSSTRNGKKLTAAEKQLDASWIADAVKTGASVIGWNANNVTREAVALAHSRGLKVWIWTVDEPTEANKFLDWGVDGLISNNPAIIWRTLALRGVKASLAP